LLRNVNGQINRYWCFKNPLAVHEVSLDDLKVKIRSALNAHKITGTAFFEETNSDCYVKLFLTHFRQVT
jgi:hypothetical protein